jgi:hypothetical protein
MADAQQSGSNQPPASLPAAKEQPGTVEQKLYVDSKVVSEEEYFKAAAKQGYDVNYLRNTGYRPSISTTKHSGVKRSK